MKTKLIKTAVKGLYFTIDGKLWHKTAKREITPTANGKVRFNGKLYDLQKLITANTIDLKTKELKPALKIIPTIRELQKEGFKKSSVKGLYLSNQGKAYNQTTNRELTPSKRGYIAIFGKSYNLAKLILETYKKTPVRGGQIIFINGNDLDFDFNNLVYTTGLHYKAPSESEIVKCIRLYYEVPKKLNRQNILFKYYLNEIAVKRGFIGRYCESEFILFLEWLKPLRSSVTKAEISAKNGFSTTNGTNAINKYLTLLVNECMQDQNNGILKIKDFEPKPLTATQKLKITNQRLKDIGMSSQIPLRKSTPKKI
ncbi:hypothetical protein [Flavobacterium sandaracinum]|uniref:Uncharacterized protein n=1 Tax=Flavobacterium sandaracinum TaxID=2541733 RepID=A0A4R5CUJ8_9FLAO|nr:hypothetical protein [Flavobacterium sandaracinum]TDE01515.1 hypothetical protein E0F91_14265 [Flavobacterium sandaracinum]